jgi:outer membrane lipoprotein SlyB
MANKNLSVSGAMVGALAGLVTEITIQEITGHHITHGVLEIAGAVAGLMRLDRRLTRALKDTLDKTQDRDDNDYRQVKQRINDLTEDLPELREILQNLVDEGIQAQKA